MVYEGDAPACESRCIFFWGKPKTGKMGERYMANNGNIEVDGFVKQRQELEKADDEQPCNGEESAGVDQEGVDDCEQTSDMLLKMR